MSDWNIRNLPVLVKIDAPVQKPSDGLYKHGVCTGCWYMRSSNDPIRACHYRRIHGMSAPCIEAVYLPGGHSKAVDKIFVETTPEAQDKLAELRMAVMMEAPYDD